MSKSEHDAYTGEELPPPWKSSIPGLMRGRSNFWRPESITCAGGYQATYTDFGIGWRWQVARLESSEFPEQVLTTCMTEAQARSIIAWCIEHDGEVQSVLRQLAAGQLVPFLKLSKYLDTIHPE